MVALSLAVALAACSGRGGGGDPTASAPTSDGARWLVAVEVAARADDLDAATQRLREPLGEALVVSPVDCFEGLPPEAGEGYVIGALAASSEVAEGLVAQAGEPLLFSASVTIVCPG
jgi:hypothetical protein